ncbi:MAG TPA: hypothetical protein VM889_04060 [Candidatus Thermoplasmatota archaeon]|nr:hypothetical protein [Candidatus Thermoplasmatota archaeon]
MRKLILAGLVLVWILGSSTPYAIASGPVPPHPHGHTYVGVAPGLFADDGENEPVTVPLRMRDLCADTPAFIHEMKPFWDSDPETGIGGACFPYVTRHGDAGGITHRIDAFEGRSPTRAVYLACLDVDHDGSCFEPGGSPLRDFDPHDIVVLCYESGGKGWRLGTKDPCLLHFKRGIPDETAYVVILGGIDADGERVAYGPNAQGWIFIVPVPVPTPPSPS